jgi:peptide alpha-N-acetyltransferase
MEINLNLKDQSNIKSYDIEYIDYTNESMIGEIKALVSKDLSEPYSIFTYRYFVHKWPNLCICAYTEKKENFEDCTQSLAFPSKILVGTIVCKAEDEGYGLNGYIAMLAVSSRFRKRKIGHQVCEIIKFYLATCILCNLIQNMCFSWYRRLLRGWLNLAVKK